MKPIKLLAPLVLAAIILSGCATRSVTTSANGSVTSRETTDPLLTKIVIQENDGAGVDFDFLGLANYFSPFKFKFGNFKTTITTIPTCASNQWTAALNSTGHGNASLIQMAGDKNLSTTTNLPAAAFVGPNVQTLNPIVQPTVAGTSAVTNAAAVGK